MGNANTHTHTHTYIHIYMDTFSGKESINHIADKEMELEETENRDKRRRGKYLLFDSPTPAPSSSTQ